MTAKVWEFIETYYPNYYNANLIAKLNDLEKIRNNENEAGDAASKRLALDYNNWSGHPNVMVDYTEISNYVTEKAIEEFMANRK